MTDTIYCLPPTIIFWHLQLLQTITTNCMQYVDINISWIDACCNILLEYWILFWLFGFNLITFPNIKSSVLFCYSTRWQHTPEMRLTCYEPQMKKSAEDSVRCCLWAYRAASSQTGSTKNNKYFVFISTLAYNYFFYGVVILCFPLRPLEETDRKPRLREEFFFFINHFLLLRLFLLAVWKKECFSTGWGNMNFLL